MDTRVRTQIPDSGPEAIGTQISPDGRWIAYQSTATGMHEVYVQPLGRPGTAVKVTSLNGAFRPLWSRDMREMFFDTVDNMVRTLWVVPVRDDVSLTGIRDHTLPFRVRPVGRSAGR